MSVMAKVLMYSTGVCPYCIQAERLLTAKGVTAIDKIRVDLQPEQRAIMMEKTGRRTVPQPDSPFPLFLTFLEPAKIIG